MPRKLIEEKEVDVALLGAGDWNAVFRPEVLVAEMRPKQVILGHWENFFRPQTRRAQDAPTQSFGDYARRIRHHLEPLGLKCKIHKPQPQDVLFVDRAGNRVDRAGRVLERAR